MRKKIIGLSGLFGLLLVILIVGFISISSFITPDFIVKQVESSLNVRADLKKVNINLFSLLSSIELENFSLHNRDSFADNANNLSERSPSENPIISVEKVDLKLNFLSLLKRKFELRNFILITPIVSVVIKENGNNLSHLFQKPKIVEGKPNLALDETENEKVNTDNSDKPFTVKSLTISANVGKIGIESGQIDIFIQKTLQKVSLKNVSLLLRDIDINPENLEKHNSILLTANANFSIFNSGGQETALLKINSNGVIVPFVPSSGLINPSINYHLKIIEGSYFEGLLIMDALSGNLPILANAGIKLEGLSKKAELMKNVELSVNYNSSKITFLTPVTLPMANYDLMLEKQSWIQINSNDHIFTGGILTSKVESDKAISQIDLAIKEKLKIENPTETRNKILKNLIKEDRIYLPFISNGNIKSPFVKLNVELPSISELTKDLVGDKLKDELGKKIPAGVSDSINKGLKKLF
ncbi:MAG: hypothetical protein IPL26_25765 [Leptospiraceae bacterium]|nr:hypothetical protein [Leptospiraceae bacterium]